MGLLSGLFSATYAGTLPDVHGHRGARAVYPENTLKGFEYALKLGVDYLEMDVGVTSDGILVLHHDQSLNTKQCRYFSNDGPIPKGLLLKNLKYAELKQFNCSARKPRQFRKQRPWPTQGLARLEDLFKALKNSKHAHAKRVKLNIEAKIHPDRPQSSIGAEKFARLLVGLIQKWGLVSRSIFQCEDPQTLRWAKKLEPKLETAYIADIGDTLKELPFDTEFSTLIPFWRSLNARNVHEFQRQGIKVIPYTANSRFVWRKLLKWKVDGIITDDPYALMKWLDSKN